MTDKTFLWAWENTTPQPDTQMTPSRAARLLRAWRGGMRAKANGRPVFTVRLRRHADGWREYRVTSKHGEAASLWIRTKGA